MKITRIYTGDDGHSRFEEIDIPLKDAGDIGRLSEHVAVKSVIFRENHATYDYDWHHAPQRQYVVMLDGEIEIETSEGHKKSFRGGDIILAEDITGRGHRTRTTNNQPRRSLFITFD